MRSLLSFLILTCVYYSYGQSFSFHSYAPFNLKIQNDQGENTTLKYIFFDLDNDGDLDALHTGVASIDEVENPTENNIHFFIEKQMNTGSRTNPLFGPRQKFAESFPMPEGYFIPAAADLNKDGKIDFILSSEIDPEGNQRILYYQNSGTSLNPQFIITKAEGLELDPFTPFSLFSPELTDVDKDGDYDLIMSGHEPVFQDTEYIDVPVFKFAKNVGTPTEPKFVGWYENPYNLLPQSQEDMFLISGDIDNDKDVDFLGGEFRDNVTLTFFENSPTPNGKSYFLEPSFTILGLPFSEVDENLFFPALVDLDGDTDLDLLITRGKEEDFLMEYYRNDDISSVDNLEMDEAILVYPNPAKNEASVINYSQYPVDKVLIFNAHGLLMTQLKEGFDRMNMGILTGGLYILEIKAGNFTVRKKLLVIK